MLKFFFIKIYLSAEISLPNIKSLGWILFEIFCKTKLSSYFQSRGHNSRMGENFRQKRISYYFIRSQRGTCYLRGYFGPLWGQKMKIAFHKFLLISLLEQKQKCKSLGFFFFFYLCYGNKNGCQNRLKIGNWPFWSKFKTFDRGNNIEHKQIPTIYFNRIWELSLHTIY